MFKKIIKGLKDVWCGSLEFDTTPKAGSYNPVTSDGVYEAIRGSVIPANVDVIKWSDVLAVQDSDYSDFVTRIAADIAAGIAPIVLDDVNDGSTAILDNVNAGGALFRTSTDCNERDVMFTNYVITDVAVSRTPFTKNLLFKNASNGYAPDADGFVEVKNNRNGVYTYTGSNSLDFLADFDSTDAVPSIRFSDVNPPNFAVKIVSTAGSDGTVTVYKKQNGIYTPLKPSVAGGTTVEAGKTYQLTCVGDCWTLAEFEEPEQGMFAMIGGKRYKVVKIGSLYWMAENLAYNATAETGDLDSASIWYDNDSSTYGDYGKLYCFTEAAREEILAAAPGWRFPTQAEMSALFTESVADLKAATGWTNAGTDGTGFSGVPGGRYFENAFGLYGTQGLWWCVPSNDPLTAFNQCYITDDSKGTEFVGDASYASVRLVKEA